MRERLALLIATKDRPREIRRLLESIRAQNTKLDQVIIVDGGIERVEHIASEFKDLQVTYLTLRPPSLVKQRNLGLRHLSPHITLVGFIDDEVVLLPNALANMLLFWENISEDAGGASFNIINYQQSRFPTLKSLFLLDNRRKGVLLQSGVGTVPHPVAKTQEVEWLCGGATVWRREVLEQHHFDEWFYELGWNEDVAFSMLVGKNARKFVVAEAQVIDTEPFVKNINNVLFGKMQIIHRLYVVKKYSQFSVAACMWASVGQLFVNIAIGLSRMDSGRLVRAWGNILGLANACLGKLWVHPNQETLSQSA